MDSINKIYPDILRDLLAYGKTRKSRDLVYRESRIIPHVSHIDPTDSLMIIDARKFNYAFNVIEKLSYISGMGFYPNVITKYVKNYSKFIEDNKTDPNSYGYRISQQLMKIYELLKREPQTRQAVINIYNYLEDNRGDKKNVPCTMNLNFYQDHDHEDYLNMVCYIRSNDVIWGYPYDVNAFCFILKVMACWLGMKPGKYTHVATSMHLYSDMEDFARKIIDGKDSIKVMNEPEWTMSSPYKTFEYLRQFWELEEEIRYGRATASTILPVHQDPYITWCLEIIQDFWDKKREKS